MLLAMPQMQLHRALMRARAHEGARLRKGGGGGRRGQGIPSGIPVVRAQPSPRAGPVEKNAGSACKLAPF